MIESADGAVFGAVVADHRGGRSILVALFVIAAVKIVQQGSVGVVKRFGEFKVVRQPGMHVLVPLVDRMDKVDMREFPMTGDQQAVITKDNVSLWVSATIFCQVIDVKAALFEIADYILAVDQLSRTALRAVFGELTLDQSLSERETINTRMQDHMADAAMKWGVRLNRIEILDITPPNNVLQAMSEQKEAEQHKRAAILKSEGEQQAAINSAGGRKQAAVLEAEGAKQAAILAAEAADEGARAPGRGREEGPPAPRRRRGGGPHRHRHAAIKPNTLAVLQLRALQDIASVAELQGRRPLRGGRPGRRGRGPGRGAEGRRRSRRRRPPTGRRWPRPPPAEARRLRTPATQRLRAWGRATPRPGPVPAGRTSPAEASRPGRGHGVVRGGAGAGPEVPHPGPVLDHRAAGRWPP